MALPLNYKPRSTIIQVMASDADYGLNGLFTYSLYNSNSMFHINATTGEISASVILQERIYLLTVLAVDKGSPPRGSRVLVNITVSRDTPRFNSSFYTFDIEENTPFGTTVGAINATAPGSISYSISNNFSLPFIVDNNGIIRSQGNIDRERRERYEFKIVARTGTMTAIVNVTVWVIDVNDMSPKFSEPSYQVGFLCLRNNYTIINIFQK